MLLRLLAFCPAPSLHRCLRSVASVLTAWRGRDDGERGLDDGWRGLYDGQAKLSRSAQRTAASRHEADFPRPAPREGPQKDEVVHALSIVRDVASPPTIIDKYDPGLRQIVRNVERQCRLGPVRRDAARLVQHPNHAVHGLPVLARRADRDRTGTSGIPALRVPSVTKATACTAAKTTKHPTIRIAIVGSTADLSVDAHRFRWTPEEYHGSLG